MPKATAECPHQGPSQSVHLTHVATAAPRWAQAAAPETKGRVARPGVCSRSTPPWGQHSPHLATWSQLPAAFAAADGGRQAGAEAARVTRPATPSALTAADSGPVSTLSPNFLSNQKLGEKPPQVWRALPQNGVVSTQGKGTSGRLSTGAPLLPLTCTHAESGLATPHTPPQHAHAHTPRAGTRHDTGPRSERHARRRRRAAGAGVRTRDGPPGATTGKPLLQYEPSDALSSGPTGPLTAGSETPNSPVQSPTRDRRKPKASSPTHQEPQDLPCPGGREPGPRVGQKWVGSRTAWGPLPEHCLAPTGVFLKN